MKYKIGVYGSAAGDYSQFIKIAEEVGHALGKYSDSIIFLTGACAGLPYAAAQAAASQGAEVWGYSSSLTLEELQSEYPNDDLTIYDKIIYVPPDFLFANNDRIRKKYRNIISTANCDAAIVISGR